MKPKKSLIEQITNFLHSKNIFAFPGILTYANNAIFILPVIVDALKLPHIHEFNTCKKISHYKKLLKAKTSEIYLNERNVTNLQLDNKLPPILCPQFCLDFCAQELKPTLNKLFELSPTSYRTRGKTDYSFNNSGTKISCHNFESESDESESEIDLFNTASLNNSKNTEENFEENNPEMFEQNNTKNIEQNNTENLAEIFNSELSLTKNNIESEMADTPDQKSESNTSGNVPPGTPPSGTPPTATVTTSYSTPKIRLTDWNKATKDGVKPTDIG